MAKLTADQIIKQFLRVRLSTGNREFPSHMIETQLPSWGMSMFNIMHSPGTYSRRFRELREKGGVVVERMTVDFNSTEQWWKLIEVK